MGVEPVIAQAPLVDLEVALEGDPHLVRGHDHVLLMRLLPTQPPEQFGNWLRRSMKTAAGATTTSRVERGYGPSTTYLRDLNDEDLVCVVAVRVAACPMCRSRRIGSDCVRWQG